MRKYAVIVAGGSGTRMGGGIPKQFRRLKDRPVLWWSMKAFHDENPDTELILVLPSQFISLWSDYFTTLPSQERFEHNVTSGGENRTESVINGLKLVDSKDALVAIHDGARPLVSPEMIRRGWEACLQTGAAVPVIPVTDSLRMLYGDDENKSVDRAKYVAVQTPQVFDVGILKGAYEKAEGIIFTDDASVVEKAGYKITLFRGSENNIKVTNPGDLEMISLLMEKNA